MALANSTQFDWLHVVCDHVLPIVAKVFRRNPALTVQTLADEVMGWECFPADCRIRPLTSERLSLSTAPRDPCSHLLGRESNCNMIRRLDLLLPLGLTEGHYRRIMFFMGSSCVMAYPDTLDAHLMRESLTGSDQYSKMNTTSQSVHLRWCDIDSEIPPSLSTCQLWIHHIQSWPCHIFPGVLGCRNPLSALPTLPAHRSQKYQYTYFCCFLVQRKSLKASGVPGLSSGHAAIRPRIITVKEALAGPTNKTCPPLDPWHNFRNYQTTRYRSTEARILPLKVFWSKFTRIRWSYVKYVDPKPWEFFFLDQRQAIVGRGLHCLWERQEHPNL